MRGSGQASRVKRAAPHSCWRFPGDRYPLVIAGDVYSADKLGNAVAPSGFGNCLALFLIEQTADESQHIGSLPRRKRATSVHWTRLLLIHEQLPATPNRGWRRQASAGRSPVELIEVNATQQCGEQADRVPQTEAV